MMSFTDAEARLLGDCARRSLHRLYKDRAAWQRKCPAREFPKAGAVRRLEAIVAAIDRAAGSEEENIPGRA